MMGLRKVVHLTSVHVISDPRVFHKECATLAKHGYEVILIAPHDRDESIDGVRIRAVPRASNRLVRMTKTVWDVYRRALREDAEVYHFHDPELILVGLLLSLQGRRVVYDIHEDYTTAIEQKPYLPRLLRGPLAKGMGLLERWLSRRFSLVLAERYYARRFPRGTLVLNYPLRQVTRAGAARAPSHPGRIRLLYTGVVAEDRGALNHANLVNLCEDVEVHFVGRCSRELAERLRRIAEPNGNRLHLVGEGTHVPYEEILSRYQSGGWAAGLALFPETPHYREKELTKFFEYMGAGIPILCSDFPVWRLLIEESGTGLYVQPDDSEAVVAAISYLTQNPAEADRMGHNGRRAVADTYNWENEAAKMLALYENLIAS